MENIKLAEIISGAILFIFCLIFTIVIKRNNENIFFSMRSSNLMIITNILIFLGFITYILYDSLFVEIPDKFNYFSLFYFLFQITIFFALVLRYFRLYLSCKNPEDNTVQFNMFEPKSYHYEYFYVRLLAFFILGILAITTIIYFAFDKTIIMSSYEILYVKQIVTDKCYNFWTVFSFCETIIFLTFFLLIEKTSLNPNVHISLEIFLISLINYIYALSMILSFYNEETKNENIKIIINIIPLIYNFLIYFVVIILPFLYGVFNKTIIIYDLPGELCSSLYLFLTKEKCFDAFYYFLKFGEERKISIREADDDNDKYPLFLNLLINIFKYRLLVNNNTSSNISDIIPDEISKIKINYLQKIIDLRYTDKNLDASLVEEAINNCNNENNNKSPFKSNLFDKIAGAVYQSLNTRFEDFRKGEAFHCLQRELKEETNIRCKLANFGLIRN